MRAMLGVLVGAGLAIWVQGSGAHAQEGLFGTREFRADTHLALPQWQGVLARLQSERDVHQRCAREPRTCPTRGMNAWNALLTGLEGEPRREQVAAVNRFVNQWRYRADSSNYGRSDYWASPGEFFRQSGDCEDYAIVKYESLRRLGFAEETLRLVVLQDSLRDIAHAVLAVRLGDEVLILDNLTDAIIPDEGLPHYLPYYSVNAMARFAHVAEQRLVISAVRGTPSDGARDGVSGGAAP